MILILSNTPGEQGARHDPCTQVWFCTEILQTCVLGAAEGTWDSTHTWLWSCSELGDSPKDLHCCQPAPCSVPMELCATLLGSSCFSLAVSATGAPQSEAPGVQAEPGACRGWFVHTGQRYGKTHFPSQKAELPFSWRGSAVLPLGGGFPVHLFQLFTSPSRL